MATADTIAQKLTAGLNPQEIEVRDVSDKHAGHAGWREGGGTHFEVTIKAAAFAGKSRLQRHRMVNAVLADDLANSIHALEMHLSD
ncbi:MAG: BolA family transcriptional regulator [Candidatus Puniceispirillum sp.]|nr:BolA family transcriptional regulator [Candidatus Puniceispirillum sp.]MBL6774109.1 BolA family transcriptional regulator [Candidatus Puniceispirillum sp.]